MYICEKCNREFSTKGSLKRHQQKVDCNNKIFICSECGREFSSKLSLEKHTRWHNPTDKMRKSQSDRLKSSWKNEDYRNNMSRIISDRQKQKDMHLFFSDLWKNEDYRNKKVNSIKEYHARGESKYSREKWEEILSISNPGWEFIKSGRVGRCTYIDMKCPECGTIKTTDKYRFKVNCNICNPYGSKDEIILLEYIKSLGFGARKLCHGEQGPYELDIYIPELNIAFEYNGCYWHSSATNTPVMYHRNKVQFFLEKGIKVYNLWEHWGIEKCKSIIRSKLGKVEKIYARKCIVNYVDKLVAEEFLELYHIDNYTRCEGYIGLYYNSDLVCVLGYGRQYTDEFQILRLAYSNYSIIGGFKKLLKFLIQEKKPKSIITFLYRDLCPDYRDSVYYRNDFTMISEVKPTLRYFDKKNGIVVSRQTYQKHKLPELFKDSYDGSLTEVENLYNNKIYAIYDSGIFKFKYVVDSE